MYFLSSRIRESRVVVGCINEMYNCDVIRIEYVRIEYVRIEYEMNECE